MVKKYLFESWNMEEGKKANQEMILEESFPGRVEQ